MIKIIKSVNHNFKRGNTLIEIIIATVIFLASIIAGLFFFSQGRVDINLSGSYRQAKELVDAQFEILREAHWNDILDISEMEEGLIETGLKVGNVTFTRTTIIESPENENLDDYMQVAKVKVEWTEKGKTQEIELETVIARAK
ncbi:hypothetical protein M0P98_09445 [bacterium]|nr:hypothetical protein [bacterium]